MQKVQLIEESIKKGLACLSPEGALMVDTGKQYFLAAKKLKENLEKENKKAYIFIDDTLNPMNYENYPFIECWVNTACPRIGTDDIININQPMINLREALDPGRAFVELEK